MAMSAADENASSFLPLHEAAKQQPVADGSVGDESTLSPIDRGRCLRWVPSEESQHCSDYPGPAVSATGGRIPVRVAGGGSTWHFSWICASDHGNP
jgi:hypothetical protein